jgi:phosphonate transport system substrate-binding protein
MMAESSLRPLRLTTLQSPNSEFIPQAVAAYLAEQLEREVEFVADIPWQQREAMLDEGEIDIAWICGLPYTWKMKDPAIQITLLAAPVMSDRRYGGQPVYFSDVVTRRDSAFEKFEDLRGASWAFNDTGSQSGYNLTRWKLSGMGEFQDYFGGVIQSGSHEESLRMVLAGHIDASSIDSTVLEIELRKNPELEKEIKVIATWGPSPIPPYVISLRLPVVLRQRIRAVIIDMARDPKGARIMADGKMLRFTSVRDKDYDPIREMERAAQNVVLA